MPSPSFLSGKRFLYPLPPRLNPQQRRLIQSTRLRGQVAAGRPYDWDTWPHTPLRELRYLHALFCLVFCLNLSGPSLAW